MNGARSELDGRALGPRQRLSIKSFGHAPTRRHDNRAPDPLGRPDSAGQFARAGSGPTGGLGARDGVVRRGDVLCQPLLCLQETDAVQWRAHSPPSSAGPQSGPAFFVPTTRPLGSCAADCRSAGPAQKPALIAEPTCSARPVRHLASWTRTSVSKRRPRISAALGNRKFRSPPVSTLDGLVEGRP